MTIAKEMIEAGARALCQVQEQNGGPPWDWFPDHERSGRMAKETFRNSARACLTAALAVAERDCAVLAVVPEAQRKPTMVETPSVQQYARGFNACRAAVLAGKVVL